MTTTIDTTRPTPGRGASPLPALAGSAGDRIRELLDFPTIEARFRKVRHRIEESQREAQRLTESDLLAAALEQAGRKERVSETLLDDLVDVRRGSQRAEAATAAEFELTRIEASALHERVLDRRAEAERILAEEMAAVLEDADRVLTAIEGVETAEQAIEADVVDQWREARDLDERWLDVQRTRVWLGIAADLGFGDSTNPTIKAGRLATYDPQGRSRAVIAAEVWQAQWVGETTAATDTAREVLAEYVEREVGQRPEPEVGL